MSRKKLIASSLTICSAAAPWSIGMTGSHPVYAEVTQQQPTEENQGEEQAAQQALVQYLNPIVTMTEGNLATKVETKPFVHEVVKGDTLFGLGQYYGFSYQQLAKFNNLEDPCLLQVGQKLNIPIVRKWIRVKMGETLESIAEKYQTTVDLIKHLNPDIKNEHWIYVGQLIAVPQRLKISYPSVTPVRRSKKVKILPISREEKAETIEKPSGSGSMYPFQWPVVGQITSNFGWRQGRQHKGIDIWNAARSKTPIRASLSGRVTRAGYAGSYGNLVVIDHGNGWVTYYAHLSRIYVSKGQWVNTGEVIGKMGSTGDSTGDHLHFEVRKNGQAINPLSVLN
jgi:murein DD-endopeptidase MepM/ murein hydrolase activator NlpD